MLLKKSFYLYMENYYNILNLDRTASMDDINKSYTHLMEYENNDQKINLIKKAYDTLSDYHKRKKYDDMLDFPLGNFINSLMPNFSPEYKSLAIKNNTNSNTSSNTSKSYFYQERVVQNIIDENGKKVLKEEHYINDNGKENTKKFKKILNEPIQLKQKQLEPIQLDLTVSPLDEEPQHIMEAIRMQPKTRRYKIIKYKN